MKKHLYALLAMLSMGVFTHIIHAANPFQQVEADKIIGDLLKNYDPDQYDTTTAKGITALWAKHFVKQLSNDERVAIIYEAFNLPINDNANKAWLTRNVENLTAAYAQFAKNWITSSLSGAFNTVTGKIESALNPITSSVSSGYQWGKSLFTTTLPELDNYLKTHRDAYSGNQNNMQWYNDILAKAHLDFRNPNVIRYLTTNQREHTSAKLDLLTDKILPVIQESAEKNSVITPWSREQVRHWLDAHWPTNIFMSQTTQQPTNPFMTQSTQQTQTPRVNPFMTQKTPIFNPFSAQQRETLRNPFAQTQQPVQQLPQQQTPQFQQQFTPQTPQQQQTLTSDTLLINYLPLNNDHKTWISNFIINAKSKQMTAQAAKTELFTKIQIGPRATYLTNNILIKAGEYFDSQWNK